MVPERRGKPLKNRPAAGPAIEQVRDFWESNRLSAATISNEPGAPESFVARERMRRLEEPAVFQRAVYEWDRYAGRDVPDVGCGTGYVVALYAQGGTNVTGVDLAEHSIELTWKSLAWRDLKAHVLKANAEELPFLDGSFDLFTDYGVLHHTPDMERAMRQAFRTLRPGRRTIMMFYHRSSFAYRLLFPAKRWLQPSWRGKTAQQQVNAVDGADNPLGKVFGRADLRRLLGRAGFKDFQFATANMFFDKARFIPRPLRALIGWRWGWQLYVKAVKPA